jgi:monofunctional biosynthetic peptidoglycan transglycosylase
MRAVGRVVKRVLLILFLLLLAYQLWIFSNVLWWKWFNPVETSFMALRLEELREKNPKAELRHTWVPYERISIHLKRAVVATEDDKFVDHHGFDWDGIKVALEKNQRRGRLSAGGSTITQQLAKNLFLSPKRSYIRKLQEAFIAGMIEALWDKRRILEVYLNVVEWGNGVFGAEAAARRYYQMSAADLNKAQAVRIGVMLPNPRRFEQRYPDYLVTHSQRILSRMHYTRVPE